MNPAAPVAATDFPVQPEWLSTRAAEIFLGLVSVIEDMGIASVSDTAALALVASRLEDVEICTAVIEDGGRTFVSSSEYVKQQIKGNPAVAKRSEACATLNRFWRSSDLRRPLGRRCRSASSLKPIPSKR